MTPQVIVYAGEPGPDGITRWYPIYEDAYDLLFDVKYERQGELIYSPIGTFARDTVKEPKKVRA